MSQPHRSRAYDDLVLAMRRAQPYKWVEVPSAEGVDEEALRYRAIAAIRHRAEGLPFQVKSDINGPGLWARFTP